MEDLEDRAILTQEKITKAFDEIARELYGIQAFLTPNEAAALYLLARDIPVPGVVVEIGAHLGGSSVALGLGCREAGASLVSIDIWEDTNVRNLNWSSNANLFPAWWGNIVEKKLTQIVTGIKGRGDDVSQYWQNPIRLLFIDAAHLYEDAKSDYEHWNSHVYTGGCIVFHDAYYLEGVTKFVEELKADKDAEFGLLAVVDTLAVFGRKPTHPHKFIVKERI